jgi:hypothetical protein
MPIHNPHLTPQVINLGVGASKILEKLEELDLVFVPDEQTLMHKDKTVYFEGQVYNKASTYVCGCCKESVPKNLGGKLSLDKTYCSVTCAQQSGYTINEYGEWIKGKSPQKTVHHYKSRIKTQPASKENPLLLGIEVEKEDQSYKQAMFKDWPFPKEWIAVHDGSLQMDDGGFEIVIPAYNLPKEKEKMFADIEKYSHLFNANYSHRCGGHISVSKYETNADTLAQELSPLIAFMLCLWPERLRSWKMQIANLEGCKINRQKHQPISLSNSGRVELRMPGAITSTRCLKRRLDLILMFLEETWSFEKTVKEMEDGGKLHTLWSPVYGPESWEEKKRLFHTTYKWWEKGENAEQIYYIKDW